MFSAAKEKTQRLQRSKKNCRRTDHEIKIDQTPFEKLHFGEMDALDKFYSCSIAAAEVTDRAYQANKLFYHLGLRESFEMQQNVVTYLDERQSYNAG